MPETPTLHNILSRLISSGMAKIRVAGPAKIISYDSATQTAEVEPQLKLTEDDEIPNLTNIPVLWPRGGDGYLVFPIETDDFGLLITCDLDIGTWREKGEQVPPGDLGRNELAFSVLFPGLAPNTSALDDVGSDGKTVLGGSKVHLGAHDSTEKVVLGTAWASFMTSDFLAAFITWLGQIDAAITAGSPPASTADLVASVTSYNTKLSGTDFLSQTVKVKE
jgi:hypothetical protein